MKKIKTTIFLATALMLSITGCISEPMSPINGERNVALRIVDSPHPRNTRNTAPIPPGTPLVFNEGHIYLVTVDGVIISHFIVAPADDAVTTLTPENLAAGIIHRNLLNTGVMLFAVPPTVTEVVIIGNTPNNVHAGNVNSELIGSRILNVITQHNAENVNLFGRSTLPSAPTIGGYFPVAVHLSPTVARFEVPSITGGGIITEFTVEGIFINNYHQNATIAGFIPDINSEPNLVYHTEATSFVYNAPGTSYTSTSNNALFYWNATANNGNGFFVDDFTVRPSNQQTSVFHPNLGGGTHQMRDHVWGFQLFARNYGETTNPETEAPRVVIRLSDIKFADGTRIMTPRFVTVGGLYRRQNGNLVPVTHIRAANVYHVIGGIYFDERHLSEKPGENEIIVEVSVTLAVWGGDEIAQPPVQPNPPASFQISYGAGGTLTLGAAHPAFLGFTYQWQRSTDGYTWEDIEGATSRNHTIPPATMIAPVYFRRMATLNNETIVTTPVRVYDEMAEYLRENLNPVELDHTALQSFTAAGVQFYMVPVTGGLFWRGTTADGINADPDRIPEREDNMHLVGVNSFRIAQTSVTRQLYTAVMGHTGSGLTPVTFMAFDFPTVAANPNMSVAANRVSWYDAIVFMNRLSVLAGLTPVFQLDGSVANINNNNARPTDTPGWGNRVTMDPDANGFRFPTEAQWEYAARGGQQNEYTRTLGASGTHLRWSGSNNINAVARWGNLSGNSNGQINPVRSLAPNDLGIYDMSGNVWDWCWDWFAMPHPVSSTTQHNPTGPATGSVRMQRGASWANPAAYTRVASRFGNPPWLRHQNLGMRVVLP